jgi:molybdenum cofactor biosynthesis enzyme MoaA
MKGVSYFLQKKLYISLTNECNSVSRFALRGPSFVLPTSAKFIPLPHGFEPTGDDIFNIVNDAFEEGKIGVDSMDSDEITFAGLGEPLLRWKVLTDAASMITEKRHGAQLRVETNGLILPKDSAKVSHTRPRSVILDTYF